MINIKLDNIKYCDNSLLWALFLFLNTYIFYIAPVKIYFDNNFGGDVVKGLIIVSIFLMSIRNIGVFRYKAFFGFILLLSFVYLMFDRTNFINVTMPVIIGLSLMRVDLNKFIYKFYLITNCFWTLYIFLFFMFYDLITSYDVYSIYRPQMGFNIDRGGIGFVSPNNIGGFLCLSAVIVFLRGNVPLAFLYLLSTIPTYLYTNSRTALVTAFLLFILMVLFKFKNLPIKVLMFSFFLCILMMVLVAVISFLGFLDNFKTLDLILSHRLHYISLILKPSFFGTINVMGLDMSLMNLLNKGGIVSFLCYVLVLFNVLKINNKTMFLVLSFLILGLSESIINQYHILAPLIFAIYFQVEKIKYHRDVTT